MERVEEVKLVPLLRGKRVTGEWENCVCVDDEREDPPSLVTPQCWMPPQPKTWTSEQTLKD